MYCKNCGNVCNNGEVTCPKCGKPLEVSYYTAITPQLKKEQVYTKEDKDKANLLAAISLLCFLAPWLISGLFLKTDFEYIVSNLSGVLELASFVLMIYVRVRYPKNVFGKVLMWLYIVLGILFIISMIIFFVACISCVQSWPY